MVLPFQMRREINSRSNYVHRNLFSGIYPPLARRRRRRRRNT